MRDPSVVLFARSLMCLGKQLTLEKKGETVYEVSLFSLVNVELTWATFQHQLINQLTLGTCRSTPQAIIFVVIHVSAINLHQFNRVFTSK